jgi:hypothetical protein
VADEQNKLISFQPFKIDDKKTGTLIEIIGTLNYSILKINERSYYFDPKTGEFDGVSSDVS